MSKSVPVENSVSRGKLSCFVLASPYLCCLVILILKMHVS